MPFLLPLREPALQAPPREDSVEAAGAHKLIDSAQHGGRGWLQLILFVTQGRQQGIQLPEKAEHS
jgi:hypothetical protein